MKKGEHNGRKAPGDRGLYDYAAIRDLSGSKVTVRLSSGVTPSVWLFCKDHEGKEIVNMAGGGMQAVSPLLDLRAAKRLRDALNRFIASVEGKP